MTANDILKRAVQLFSEEDQSLFLSGPVVVQILNQLIDECYLASELVEKEGA